jgi:hypothetical protein
MSAFNAAMSSACHRQEPLLALVELNPRWQALEDGARQRPSGALPPLRHLYVRLEQAFVFLPLSHSAVLRWWHDSRQPSPRLSARSGGFIPLISQARAAGHSAVCESARLTFGPSPCLEPLRFGRDKARRASRRTAEPPQMWISRYQRGIYHPPLWVTTIGKCDRGRIGRFGFPRPAPI